MADDPRPLTESGIAHLEEQIPLLAEAALRAAYWQTLMSGHSVLIEDGDALVEVFPDGTRRFVKALPPPVRVRPGTYTLDDLPGALLDARPPAGSLQHMPITLTLDDDLLAALRARSEAEGRPVEAVLADAVRRGLASPPRARTPAADDEPSALGGDVRDGIRLFPVRPGTPVVTHDEDVRRMQDEIDRQDAERAGAIARGEFRNGIRLFPRRPGAPVVTVEAIRRLRDATE